MRFLVIGDIMLDRYTYVRTTRKAPEADIPVWDEVKTEIRLGGAANVAHNIKALGGDDVRVFLAGIMGDDDGSNLLKGVGIETLFCFGTSTMTKHRYVDLDTGRYVVRVDNFRKFPEEQVELMEMLFPGSYTDFDCVVFSDYDKGTLTEKIVEPFRKHPLTVVDSKRDDVRLFEGMKVFKVNEQEYAYQVSSKLYPNFTEFFEYCVVTKGGKGADLLMCERTKSSDRRYIVHTEKFPIEEVKAVDVTGCGDTHTAAMAFSLVKNGDVRASLRFANACARQVVQKFGTSVI